MVKQMTDCANADRGLYVSLRAKHKAPPVKHTRVSSSRRVFSIGDYERVINSPVFSVWYYKFETLQAYLRRQASISTKCINTIDMFRDN